MAAREVTPEMLNAMRDEALRQLGRDAGEAVIGDQAETGVLSLSLSQEDIDICRAFGVPRLLMYAVRYPEEFGSGRYFIARVRDVPVAFNFSGAVLSNDNLWVTLLNAYDPGAGDNEVCAVDVRLVDLLTVTITRADGMEPPRG